MTPRWISFDLSIVKMIISGHFDLFGPKNGPKKGQNGLKIQFSEILFKHRHVVTLRWKWFGLKIMSKIILGHFDLFGPIFLTF